MWSFRKSMATHTAICLGYTRHSQHRSSYFLVWLFPHHIQFLTCTILGEDVASLLTACSSTWTQIQRIMYKRMYNGFKLLLHKHWPISTVCEVSRTENIFFIFNMRGSFSFLVKSKLQQLKYIEGWQSGKKDVIPTQQVEVGSQNRKIFLPRATLLNVKSIQLTSTRSRQSMAEEKGISSLHFQPCNVCLTCTALGKTCSQ